MTHASCHFFLEGSIIGVFVLPLNMFLYWGSEMILYCFHNLRKAVKLLLKGCDNCYVSQCM